MAKGQWVGVNGVARKVKTKYVGVSGVARKIKAGWVGVSGVARQYFSSGISYTFVEGKGTASEITSQTVSAGVSGSNWYFSVTAPHSALTLAEDSHVHTLKSMILPWLGSVWQLSIKQNQ